MKNLFYIFFYPFFYKKKNHGKFLNWEIERIFLKNLDVMLNLVCSMAK
jgi:hypothetical protein